MGRPCDGGGKRQHNHNKFILLSGRMLGLRRNLVACITISLAFAVFLTLCIAVINAERNSSAKNDNATTVETAVECDLFSGRWIYDNSSHPLYVEEECMFMSDQLACGKFGRKEFKYQNWRWKPHHCDLPRYLTSHHYVCKFRFNQFSSCLSDQIQRNCTFRESTGKTTGVRR